MALSLQNPLRGNLNRLFRRGASASEAAAILSATAKLPKGAARDAKLRRLGKAESKALRDFLKSGKARVPSKSDRLARGKSKRAWMKSVLGSLGGAYAKRGIAVRKTHAGRYRSEAKKKTNARGQVVVNVEVGQKPSWTQKRMADRAKGVFRKRDRKAKAPKASKASKKSGKRSTTAKASQGVRRAVPAGLREATNLKRDLKGMGYKVPKGAKLAELRAMAGTALNNPGTALLPMGDLAFTNPAMGATSYLTGYVFPVAVAGAVGGGLHAALGISGVTEKMSSTLQMIPVVGPVLAERAPFTTQGVVAGALLALGAAKIGGSTGKYMALAGGAAIVFGAGIDVFNAISGFDSDSDEDSAIDAALDAASSATADAEATGDLAFTNVSALGDLAFTNGSALGDGFAFEVAPLTADGEYGQCSLADAAYAGPDFTPREGQALLNGRQVYLATFGAPSRRAGTIQGGASHLAGKPGHRWGWLVKLVGWERAQRIAQLPPARRVVAIAQLRRGAINAYNKMVSAQSVTPGLAATSTASSAGVAASAPSAPSTATGADGSTGVNYLGEPALFVGA